MKHTPGPWSFRWETEQRDWAIVQDKYGKIVANVNTETGPDAASAPAMHPMPAEANAALIAAAPDMFKALVAQEIAEANDRGEDILPMMEAIGEDERYWDCSDLRKWAAELRRATIQKARGE